MPRPSSRPTGAVWRLLERWSAEHPLRPNQSQMANLFEISDSLLGSWKFMDSVIQEDDITFIANVTGLDKEEIGKAALEDRPFALMAVQARRTGPHGRKRRRSSA